MTEPAQTNAARPTAAAGLSDATLEELNRLWTIVRAFSNTAHDVNNALQVIAGNAELLEARELEPSIARRVEIMRVECGKAAAAINSLLTFARGSRQPVQQVDVWTLLDVAVGMRAASLGRGRIVLAVDRSAPTPARIDAASPKVLQALLDVLLVAEDRVSGLGKARIDVKLTSVGGQVVLRVVSSADQPDGERPVEEEALPAPETLTRDAQLWAAGYLAALTGGTLHAEDGILTLQWPETGGLARP